ncbi:cation diffusion facilitator family transporter [Niallia taxi]|uniref:cation diffusion facilitator family transporter n=1 Tax=Niallia taxi TaxID=2499688 RepID=UPI002E1F5864|nr:cation diffusion facilitator family transporter [Niallia taxi]MED4122036.1 cation diffusion facilitator family transporter [Niallia taxi]
MEEQKFKDLKLGERGAIISIIAYILLSIIKVTVGYLTDSAALRADGLNNTTDIIASLAVLIGLKLSQRPADKDHKYGHWKSEAISSMVASFIMMVVGIEVLFGSITSLSNGNSESPDVTAAIVGIFSAVIMYGVYRYNKALALKIKSSAVMSAAKDNISDAWVSIGTAIGILGAQLNMPWLDSVTALIVGLLICKTAWDIFRNASHELSDGFDENKLDEYKQEIISIDGIKGIKEMKGRSYGNNEVIDVEILVNSTLDVKKAHDIADKVEAVLNQKYGVYQVHVHIEPH